MRRVSGSGPALEASEIECKEMTWNYFQRVFPLWRLSYELASRVRCARFGNVYRDIERENHLDVSQKLWLAVFFYYLPSERYESGEH